MHSCPSANVVTDASDFRSPHHRDTHPSRSPGLPSPQNSSVPHTSCPQDKGLHFRLQQLPAPHKLSMPPAPWKLLPWNTIPEPANDWPSPHNARALEKGEDEAWAVNRPLLLPPCGFAPGSVSALAWSPGRLPMEDRRVSSQAFCFSHMTFQILYGYVLCHH